MKGKIAFIFSQFPCYDEVFILREMRALAGRLDFIILSLKSSRSDPLRHEMSLPLMPRVVYSPLFLSLSVWTAFIGTLLRRPFRCFRALGEVIGLHFKSPEMMLKSLALFPQAIYFARVCREQGVGRVHAQWATYPAAAALIISRLNRVGFSFTGHAHDIYQRTAGLRGKLARADFVVTCTAANRNYLAGLAGPGAEEKIKVVYHGIDLDHYAYRGARRRNPGREFRLLSVGSLFECKGYDTLLAACRLLQERGFNFRCRIVGGGYLARRLEETAARWKLSGRVDFSGYQAQEKMPEHYRWADLLVLAAVGRIHWGIPNVLLEAMAVGVPIACTELPALSELLGEGDDRCGFIFPEDPGVLASTIAEAAAADDRRASFSEKGRRKIEEKWDLRANSLSLARLFENSAEREEGDD